jgi:hypothetical protein
MFDDRKVQCRVCNQRYVEDLTSIDTLAPGERESWERIHKLFSGPGGRCNCPLCHALNNQLNRENGL